MLPQERPSGVAHSKNHMSRGCVTTDCQTWSGFIKKQLSPHTTCTSTSNVSRAERKLQCSLTILNILASNNSDVDGETQRPTAAMASAY